ncbi:MAG TPA: DUF616 domain-containing protein [Candidatus Paceibacterota bacterium]|nr:DUF616 domain-containing protein [Candidatus Paceibacterota bacterium]
MIKINSVFTPNILDAKRIKILPFENKNTNDIYVWLDSNIELLISKELLVKEFLGDNDMGLFKHPIRNNIKDEAEAIRIYRPQYYEAVKKQVDKYLKTYKDDKGLYECGVLILRNNERVRNFCQDWWKEIIENSPRDQISFPFVLNKHNIKIKANDGDVRQHNWFKFK